MRHATPRPWQALLLLPLLAACAANTPPPRAGLPEDPACRAEARQAATVRDLGQRANIGNATHTAQLAQMQADAESRAYLDCLRRRGLIRGGGVEPVRR